MVSVSALSVVSDLLQLPMQRLRIGWCCDEFLKVHKYVYDELTKKITTINTDLYESKIAPYLTDIQRQFKECSIGSYPYFNFLSKTGGVNIVLSSWTMDTLIDVEKEIIDMIKLNGGKYSINW